MPITTTHIGWGIFVIALGMMLGLMGQEISSLSSWSDAWTPKFVGEMFMHLSATIAAFVGGKMMPTNSA